MPAARRNTSRSQAVEQGQRGKGRGFIEEGLRDKESARDCVEKKKEIFLVQLAVDTRKAEILKLHDKLARKEEALRTADQQLAKEMQKFDEFLRATDQKAQAAMREADEVGRRKLEKQNAIKELQDTLSRCAARITAYEELVQEGTTYKNFLTMLSPREWVEEQERKREERRAMRCKAWVQRQLELQDQRLKADMQQVDKETAEEIAEYEEKKKKGHKYLEDARRDLEEKAERRKKLLKRKLLTAADFQAAYKDEDADEQFALYFTDPQQLLDIVKHLEEQNLFLIQNTQDNEAALEDVVSKFEETKHQTEERTKALEETIKQLQQQIQSQKQACAQLQNTLLKKNTEKEEKLIYEQLTSKIAELHAICGYEGDASTDAISRLEQIEARMEDYLSTLAKYEAENPELIARLERAKEKERRERARQAKLDEQSQKSDERLQASLKRSQKLTLHRRGKPIMFRSPPFRHRKEAPRASADDAQAEQEFYRYFC